MLSFKARKELKEMNIALLFHEMSTEGRHIFITLFNILISYALTWYLTDASYY